MSKSLVTCNGLEFHTSVNTILLRMDKCEKITKSGIIIPDTAKKKTDFSGTIVAVSRGVEAKGEMKVGDRAIVSKNTKRTLPTDDNENEYNLYNLSEVKLYGL